MTEKPSSGPTEHARHFARTWTDKLEEHCTILLKGKKGGQIWPGIRLRAGHLPDIDVHFARAKAAVAEMVVPLKDTDYGSREYGARDLEGRLWHFGTYLPDVAES